MGAVCRVKGLEHVAQTLAAAAGSLLGHFRESILHGYETCDSAAARLPVLLAGTACSSFSQCGASPPRCWGRGGQLLLWGLLLWRGPSVLTGSSVATGGACFLFTLR